MADVLPYGLMLTLVALAATAAVVSARVSQWLRIPAPAIFLLVAAAASDLIAPLARMPISTVQRVVTAALVVVLFDGGMHVGWRRMRTAVGAVAWLGVAGTVCTALAVAALAHLAFGMDWRLAMVVGTALAPTDPAVVFSVLGRREVTGRTGVLLEGESGANDPVGIALMAALLAGGARGGWPAVAVGLTQFAEQMVIGAAVGLAGGFLLSVVMRRVALPSEGLHPLRTLAGAFLIYGLATIGHGSGFLAVFLAGVVLGDVRAPYRIEIGRFHSALASIGEIVAFTVLGLSISLRGLADGSAWLIGVVLAVALAFVIRPLVVGLLLMPVRLRLGEKVFVAWSGLKGAVPILLGTFALTAGVPHARRLYEMIFVVVTVSVLVQGGLVPTVARLCKVAMRVIEPEPWALAVRFRDEPQGVHRYVVAAGSSADGRTIGELSLGEGIWVSVVLRDGAFVAVTGETGLRPGDEVVVIRDPASDIDPGQLFLAAPGPPEPRGPDLGE